MTARSISSTILRISSQLQWSWKSFMQAAGSLVIGTSNLIGLPQSMCAKCHSPPLVRLALLCGIASSKTPIVDMPIRTVSVPLCTEFSLHQPFRGIGLSVNCVKSLLDRAFQGCALQTIFQFCRLTVHLRCVFQTVMHWSRRMSGTAKQDNQNFSSSWWHLTAKPPNNLQTTTFVCKSNDSRECINGPRI